MNLKLISEFISLILLIIDLIELLKKSSSLFSFEHVLFALKDNLGRYNSFFILSFFKFRKSFDSENDGFKFKEFEEYFDI